jgi:uncharacterized protein (DUF4415 family)
MGKRDIKRYTLAQLKARLARRGGVLRTRPDAPAYELDDTFWREAVVRLPPPGKTSIHLRLDRDVLAWFKGQGDGHLSRMNAVLRSYMEAQQVGDSAEVFTVARGKKGGQRAVAKDRTA